MDGEQRDGCCCGLVWGMAAGRGANGLVNTAEMKAKTRKSQGRQEWLLFAACVVWLEAEGGGGGSLCFPHSSTGAVGPPDLANTGPNFASPAVAWAGAVLWCVCPSGLFSELMPVALERSHGIQAREQNSFRLSLFLESC